MGLSLARPSNVGLRLLALRHLACVDPVIHASGFLYRPSSDRGNPASAPGLFHVDADTSPFGSEDAMPESLRVCVWSLFSAGSGGLAIRACCGAPHPSCGRFF